MSDTVVESAVVDLSKVVVEKADAGPVIEMLRGLSAEQGKAVRGVLMGVIGLAVEVDSFANHAEAFSNGKDGVEGYGRLVVAACLTYNDRIAEVARVGEFIEDGKPFASSPAGGVLNAAGEAGGYGIDDLV
ncbi:hypothetical protein HOE67_02325 [Candidatus Peregrinibacteria bacterium]|jgi:hypothetical protein|nr:hypothetical protein [Candidatus Peregrinibacteria bacterium]MBT4055925.1 hypothetical protein [Candidatus Peregrinibacteria bacterium]